VNFVLLPPRPWTGWRITGGHWEESSAHRCPSSLPARALFVLTWNENPRRRPPESASSAAHEISCVVPLSSYVIRFTECFARPPRSVYIPTREQLVSTILDAKSGDCTCVPRRLLCVSEAAPWNEKAKRLVEPIWRRIARKRSCSAVPAWMLSLWRGTLPMTTTDARC